MRVQVYWKHGISAITPENEVRCAVRVPLMPWFRSPVKLFGCAALFLIAMRIFFPPSNGSAQLHSYVHFFDIRLDLTGYGVFEFAALVFVLTALAYHVVSRLTDRSPNTALVYLHFWPSVFFAALSVYLAHRVSRIPASDVSEQTIQTSLRIWLTAFTWAFAVFLLLQIAFAVGAVQYVRKNRKAVVQV